MRRVTWALVSALAVLCTNVGSLDAAPAVSRPEPVQAGPAASAEAAPVPEPQQVLPGVLLVPKHHVKAHHHKRARETDERFFAVSSTGSNNIPEVALRAYHHATDVVDAGGCGLSWTFLAAIGRVESDHGRYGGAQIATDGVSRPPIIGPRLDGAGPFAAVRDSDHGKLDGDAKWDHAVGQMQFLPSTWRMVASDGDGDGVEDPDDVDDSALGAARYLCRFGYLGSSTGMARAAYGYNQSDYYVSLVLAFEEGYRTGVFAIPSPPPVGPAHPGLDGKPKATHTAKPKPQRSPVVVRHHRSPTPKPSPKPTPKPAPKPSPEPTSTPTPTPSAPVLHALVGPLLACGADYCIGTTKLDVGDATVLAHTAAADFDADGTVETNAAELTGLVGATVHLQVDAGGVVYVIEGHGFRNADGSFAH